RRRPVAPKELRVESAIEEELVPDQVASKIAAEVIPPFVDDPGMLSRGQPVCVGPCRLELARLEIAIECPVERVVTALGHQIDRPAERLPIVRPGAARN